MIPGPYSVCIATMEQAESNCMTYRTVGWGHDTEAEALQHLEVMRQDPVYAGASMVVIRTIESPE